LSQPFDVIGDGFLPTSKLSQETSKITVSLTEINGPLLSERAKVSMRESDLKPFSGLDITGLPAKFTNHVKEMQMNFEKTGNQFEEDYSVYNFAFFKTPIPIKTAFRGYRGFRFSRILIPPKALFVEAIFEANKFVEVEPLPEVPFLGAYANITGNEVKLLLLDGDEEIYFQGKVEKKKFETRKNFSSKIL